MICLDTNVLLEIILDRDKAAVCKEYIRKHRLAKTGEDLAVTMLSLHLVTYFAERKNLSALTVKSFLDLFVWLPLSPDDAQWAFANFDGKDFEDGLQVACAKREKCSRFTTLDKHLAAKYNRHLKIDFLT